MDGGLLESGAPIELCIGGYPVRLREEIGNWIAKDPRRARAEWRNYTLAPLKWAIDGGDWSPTGLAKEIAFKATGERPQAITGPKAWQTATGETLSEVAGFGPIASARDWSDLHKLLGVVNPGEWVAYGDLAKLIDSSAIAVGRHVTVCTECTAAYRALGADGKISGAFTWGEPADRSDPVEVLQAEGLHFRDGKADPVQQVSAQALAARLDGQS